MQGLAVDSARGSVYVSQDMDGDSGNNIQINELSLSTGAPLGLRIFLGCREPGTGPRPGFSIERDRDGSYFLWTSHHGGGLSRVNYEINATTPLADSFLPPGQHDPNDQSRRQFPCYAREPQVGHGRRQLPARRPVGGRTAHSRVRFCAILVRAITGAAPAPAPVHSFTLAAAQMTAGLSFQGIAMDDAGIVYCLTGDTDAFDGAGAPKPKQIFAYSVTGEVLGNVSIDIDRDSAESIGSSGEYEPEGLSLVRNPVSGAQQLYFSLMFWVIRRPGEALVRLFVC